MNILLSKQAIDPETLREDLRRDAKTGRLYIVMETDTRILTEDYDQDRCVNYRIAPPSREWLSSIFYFPKDCRKDEAAFKNRCVDILMAAGPDMLMNLRHVFFVRTKNDIKEICELRGARGELFPEILEDEDGEPSLTHAGCFWYARSSLIINMHCIEDTSDEIDPNDAGLIPEGVYITLAHELRHLGLVNPYLPEEEYPASLQEEAAVEEWARSLYESVIYHEKGGISL